MLYLAGPGLSLKMSSLLLSKINWLKNQKVIAIEKKNCQDVWHVVGVQQTGYGIAFSNMYSHIGRIGKFPYSLNLIHFRQFLQHFFLRCASFCNKHLFNYTIPFIVFFFPLSLKQSTLHYCETILFL